MTRIVSLAVLLALILLLGGLLFQVIAPFILPLFLAGILALVCQPLHQYFLRLTGHRRALAAGLSTGSLAAILVVPMVVVTFICARELLAIGQQHFEGDWHEAVDNIWQHVVVPTVAFVKKYAPGQLTDAQIEDLKDQMTQNLQSLAGQIATKTFQITSSTVGVFVSLSVGAGMFIFALYYFFADGPAMIITAEELIPLPMDHQRRLRQKFATVVRAVVTATFVAAFFQGVATAVALQICGFGYFWIFLAVATFSSLIPLVGAWIVWAPCAVWLALHGQWTAATLLSIWGLVFVSTIDNVVKVYILQNDADLHPLLAFLSVVGALQVLGLWGIFIGPIVASCLFALIQIFNTELRELTKERSAMTSSTGVDAPQPVVESVAAAVVAVQVPQSDMQPSNTAKVAHGHKAQTRNRKKS